MRNFQEELQHQINLATALFWEEAADEYLVDAISLDPQWDAYTGTRKKYKGLHRYLKEVHD